MIETQTPDWYMTPTEFADLVHKVYIDHVYNHNSFAIEGEHHPEDLSIDFQSIVEIVALTLVAMGKQ